MLELLSRKIVKGPCLVPATLLQEGGQRRALANGLFLVGGHNLGNLETDAMSYGLRIVFSVVKLGPVVV